MLIFFLIWYLFVICILINDCGYFFICLVNLFSDLLVIFIIEVNWILVNKLLLVVL